MGRGDAARHSSIAGSLLVVVLLAAASVTHASEIEKWLIMPGPVANVHASIESDCGACHAPLSETSEAELCGACHEGVVGDLATQSGFHGRLQPAAQAECASCHTEHEGRDTDILAFDASAFDHSQTDFALRGAHAALECGACHANGAKHRDAPGECVDCHRSDDAHNGQLGDDCGSCHNAASWLQATFDHAKTGFTLTGAHDGITCAGCHASESFAEVGRSCNDCHRDQDVHKGRNGVRCGDCHATTTWSSVTFDHARVAGFRLDGGHRGLPCSACHVAASFTDLQTSECSACHDRDDPHEGRFGPDCGSCHTTASWRSAGFDHAAKTGFALPPGHDELQCEQCHSGSPGAAVPTDCGTCHAGDDVHEGQLGSRCESCHVATNWTAMIAFAHELTAFPLIGAHADVACDKCHATAAFHDADTACIACHAGDDVHAGSLGTQCDDCHNPATWRAWQFDHDTHTRFPLSGAHADVRCEACHRDAAGRGESPPSDCSSCHRRDDPHFGRFGNNCEACHTTTSFSAIEGM